jgi:hypothetical protein
VLPSSAACGNFSDWVGGGTAAAPREIDEELTETDEECGETDPAWLVTQRLIEAIDRMGETLVSAKRIALEGGS